jgi:ribonuclease HI
MQNRFKVCPTCKGFFTSEDKEYCSTKCEDQGRSPYDYVTLVSTDGGLVGQNSKALAATYGYCLVDADDKLIEEGSGCTEDFKTSPQAEVLGMITALEKLPAGWSGKVECDCLYALKVVFKTDYWDGYIWKDKKLDPRLKARRDELMKHLDFDNIEIELISGHPNNAERKNGVAKNGRRVSEWNVRCDEMATDESDRYKERKNGR